MTHHFMSNKGLQKVPNLTDGSMQQIVLPRNSLSHESLNPPPLPFPPSSFAFGQNVLVRETIRQVPIFYPFGQSVQGPSNQATQPSHGFMHMQPQGNCWAPSYGPALVPTIYPQMMHPGSTLNVSNTPTIVAQAVPKVAERRPLSIVDPKSNAVERNVKKLSLQEALNAIKKQTVDRPNSKSSGDQLTALEGLAGGIEVSAIDGKSCGDLKDESMEEDSQELQSKTRYILKKITPQTFDRLSQEFVFLEPLMTGAEQMMFVIDAVFKKVCDEPRFSEMCGILCEMLSQTQTSNSKSSGDKQGSFRYHLMIKCQQIFEMSKNGDLLKDEKFAEIETAQTEELKTKIREELERNLSKRKSTILGSIRFIGDLCQRKLVKKFVAHLCIQQHLLTKPNDIDSLRCLCKFLTTVGKSLDDESTQNVQAYFEKIEKILKSPFLPKRIQIELKKLIDLRNNKWVADSIHAEGETTARTAECFVCFEERSHQKFLSCSGTGKKHSLCELCIRKLAKKASWSMVDMLVECPVCRSVTLLPNGDPSKLKTKFFLDIICEDCSASKDIEEQNWCKKCMLTICCACAFKNHPSHDVNPWEDYDVPSECLSVIKKDQSQLKDNVVKFCQELSRTLIALVDQAENRSAAFAVEVESSFGPLKTSSETTLNDDGFEKKLKIVLEILKSNNFSLNEEVDDLINKTIDPIKFPSLNELVKLFEST